MCSPAGYASVLILCLIYLVVAIVAVVAYTVSLYSYNPRRSRVRTMQLVFILASRGRLDAMRSNKH